ncbi:MAG TPA: BON domain-containing protein [Terriglobales bacterium]
MKQILFGLVLLLATSAFAQYPGQQPPQSTPPTFPQGQQARPEQMPPDQMAPDQDAQAQRMSTEEVQQQIQKGLSSQPSLRNTQVEVRVTEASVFLSGTVDSEVQHELALRVAGSYAGDRQLIDQIKVRG